MAAASAIRTDSRVELCTFSLGGNLCGVDILRVQEINRQLELTPVPLAPPYVLGVTNLRGRVITVMDLGAKIGLGSRTGMSITGGWPTSS